MANISCVLARLRREPLADLHLCGHIEQLCRQCGLVWRERLFTPLTTLRLFILQILHGNTSIAHLRQLSGVDFAPGSYCEARQRLPMALFQFLLASMTAWVGHPCPGDCRQRVLIVDSSNFSMSDGNGLREFFGLPPRTRVGIGYPVAKILGLLDLSTGLFVRMLALPLFTSDWMGMQQLHSMLQAGDILLGDRLYCAYAHLAALQARGVLGCFRLHQQRDPTRLGLQQWTRPTRKNAPGWMSLGQFLQLPEHLLVRVIRYTVQQKGFRSKEVAVATTLLDEKAWPDQKLAELYGQRWRIETCFNHLKTTMKMNVLKGQSLEVVARELAVYLLVYNLVRLAMLKAAEAQRVSVWRISFVDAYRWLCCRMLGLSGVAELIVNPTRPGRWEPRVVRRRPKEHRLMTKPRDELKAAIRAEDAR
jgi:hypothetical protein